MKIIYTTFPDESTAREIAKKLVEDRLIACANIFPISSFYYWEGEIQKDSEYGAILKTTDNIVNKAVEKLKTLHPYTAPAIIVINAELKSEKYEEWMKEVTKPD